MSDKITRWLDESQQLADEADYGPWEAYGRGGYARPRVQSVKSLGGGGIVAHTGYGDDDERAGLDARFIAEARTRLPQAVAALRAVLDLHVPHEWHNGEVLCLECDDNTGTFRDYPCGTVRAITDALGDDDE